MSHGAHAIRARRARRVRMPLLMLCFAGLLGGCHFEEGSGHFGEQHRHLGSFDRVDVSGDFDRVSIEACDDCLPSARVRGDDNLIDDVVTSAVGSTLELSTHGTLWPTLPLEVIIQGPPTVRITLSGSARVSVDGVVADRYDADVSGSGEVSVRGQAAHFEAEVSGSGAVRAFDLLARSADVHVSGSGRVEVCAFERLDASVSGSGDVRFDCTPRSLGRHISGSGTIRGR